MKPEEFNHIILPLRQELLSRAFGMTGNGEDAEDLVQEAMLRLWKRRLAGCFRQYKSTSLYDIAQCLL